MSTATLPNYNLSPPTEEDARSSLERICCDGARARKWDQLRTRSGATPDRPLSLDELNALAESCLTRAGCEKVFGMSLLVRIQTYLALREQLLGPQRA